MPVVLGKVCDSKRSGRAMLNLPPSDKLCLHDYNSILCAEASVFMPG